VQVGTGPGTYEVQVGLTSMKAVKIRAEAEGFEAPEQVVNVQSGSTIDLPMILVPKAILLNRKDGAEMVWVPAGEFLRGSNDGLAGQMQQWMQAAGLPFDEGYLDREKPQKRIAVDGFWMYKTEVTVRQYRAFCTATGRPMPEAPKWGWQDEQPIVNVNWEDARAYVEWAGVSLPSEAQWEKAARGSDGRLFPWGGAWPPANGAGNFADDALKQKYPEQTVLAGYSDGYAETAPVGSFPADKSPYGCVDMAGNVLEWCLDNYDEGFYGTESAHNPLNTAASERRVARGGSWMCSSALFLSATRRNPFAPDLHRSDLGFRCCKVPGP